MIALTFAKVYRRKAKKLHTEKRALYQELLQGVELLKSLTEYDHIFHLLFIQVCLQHINHHPNMTIIIVNVEQCFCQIFVTGVNSQTFSHTNTPSLW